MRPPTTATVTTAQGGVRDGDAPATGEPAAAWPDACRRGWRKIGGGWLLLCGVFFAAYFVYVWQAVDPQMVYDAHGLKLPSGDTVAFPLFFRGAEFFGTFLDRPGGPAEYAAAFLMQYFYFAPLGPAILTLLAWAVYLSSGPATRNGNAAANRILRFLPPLLLLLVYGRYIFCVPEILALAFALSAAGCYRLAARRLRSVLLRIPVFVAGAAMTYYVAAGPFLLYAVLCAAFELLERRRFLAAGAYVALAVGAPALGSLTFRMDLAPAFFRLSGMAAGTNRTTVAVFAAINALVLVLAVVGLPRQRWERLAAALTARTGKLGDVARRARATIVLPALAATVAGAWIAWHAPDAGARHALRLNFLARREMWPEFLEELRAHPPAEYDYALLCDLNRALYETDRLSSDMFAYPQRRGGLFRVGASGAFLPGACDVLLRLGCVNEAEHTAHEALEIHGERPATLRQLALIYVAKGRPETAAVFLRVLAKDIVYGGWAEDCLRRLDADPRLGDDAEVCRLRACMVQKDRISAATVERDCLLALLERNGQNRMAFEYLMAYYLLHRRPDMLAAQMRRLDELGYPDVPPVYAEAFLLDARIGNRPATIPGRTIAPEVVARVDRVMQIVAASRGDREIIDAAMAAEFPASVSRYLLERSSESKP